MALCVAASPCGHWPKVVFSWGKRIPLQALPTAKIIAQDFSYFEVIAEEDLSATKYHLDRLRETFKEEKLKLILRDGAETLKNSGIAFIGSKDHVIFEKDEVLKNDGGPYTVFTPYSRKWKFCQGNTYIAEPGIP